MARYWQPPRRNECVPYIRGSILISQRLFRKHVKNNSLDFNRERMRQNKYNISTVKACPPFDRLDPQRYDLCLFSYERRMCLSYASRHKQLLKLATIVQADGPGRAKDGRNWDKDKTERFLLKASSEIIK